MEVRHLVQVSQGAQYQHQTHAHLHLMSFLAHQLDAFGMDHHVLVTTQLVQDHTAITQDAQAHMVQVAQAHTTQETAQVCMVQGALALHHVQASHMETVHLKQGAQQYL